jgi:hypothetical protein
MNASNGSFLFVKEDDEQIPEHALTVNFRTAAKKMGLIIEDETNPFRPKRFRGLFRTACGLANIDPGYTMAFMGHTGDMSASYLEKPMGLFLREYIRIEPWVTVYGVDKSQILEVTEHVDELTQEINVVKAQNEELSKKLGCLADVDVAKFNRFLMYLDDFLEIKESIKNGELLDLNNPALTPQLKEELRKAGLAK